MSLDEATRVKIANGALKAEPLAVAQALAEDLALDLRQDIAKLTMPVTVLYQAEANPAASKERYENDYAALKGPVLVPVAKTAHFVMLDRPDAFDAALAALLAR